MEKRLLAYIRTWEKRCYVEGIPDESPIEINDMVPSYRRIALAILKNDYPLKTLGFSPPKSEHYNSLKRIELNEREKIIKMYKKEQFTEGMADILKSLASGCNIVLYRQGLIRLRDKNHNPIKNVRSDLWEKVKEFCVKLDGLWVFNEDLRKQIPTQILR